MKKYILLILLFSVLVIASFVYVRFNGNLEQPAKIDVTQLPTIGTSGRTNVPQNVPFQWQQIPDLPSAASVFSFSEIPSIKELIVAVIRSLFPSATLTNEDNTVAFWSADPYSIIFDAYTGTLSISLNPSSVTGGLLPKEQVFSVVSSLLSPSFSFSLVQTSQFSAPGQFAQIEGPIIKEDYSVLLQSSSPLLRQSFSSSALTLLLSDQNVLSVDFFIPAFSYEKKKDVQILTTEQILQALQLNKGFLAFVYDNNVTTEYEAVPKYSSVLLTSARLGYIKEDSRQMLVPVFILDGIGVSAQGRQTVQYILRASL
jgi:hypothetical protein